MTYQRRTVIDNETVIDKDHYDNLQDGIEEALELASLVQSTGIPKLLVYVEPFTIQSDGQLTVNIKLSSFDASTDTVMVFSGLTKLSPSIDYTINEYKQIRFTQGLPKGRTGDIYIFKNVPMGDAGSVSGKVLAQGTIPLDRLEKDVLPTDGSVPMSGLDLWFNTGKHSKVADDNAGGILLYAQNTNDSENCRVLRLRNQEASSSRSEALTFEDKVDGESKTYKIFGEHNKPSGSYTGNGSATARTVDIGGINDNVRAVIITSLKGITFVTSGSAVAIGTDGAKKISNVWMGSNMNLNIKSTNEFVNANGETYYYHAF